MKYQIGDFSKISRLSVKTLRYYHECGLLEPAEVDDSSGYRYYSEKSLGQAEVIKELKELDFSLKEIKTIIDNYDDDSELSDFLRKKAGEITEKIKNYSEIQEKLNLLIKRAEKFKMVTPGDKVVIKDIPAILTASIRFQGRYQDLTPALRSLLKSCGKYCTGATFSLYYDNEYKEENADIEACIPVKKIIESGGIKCRELEGGKAVTLVHRGAYETIGRSYKALIDYINEKNYKILPPSREVYLKGPGMLLPGNPQKFITEIQMMLAE